MEKFYRTFIMGNECGELAHFAQHGIVVRVGWIAAFLAELTARDERALLALEEEELVPLPEPPRKPAAVLPKAPPPATLKPKPKPPREPEPATRALAPPPATLNPPGSFADFMKARKKAAQ